MSTEYLAGFFDGEGYIGLQHGASNPTPRTVHLNVGQIDPRPLEALQKAFGGHIHVRKGSKKYVAQRDMFSWQLRGKLAADALEAMLPFLLVKKEQAIVALRFHSLVDASSRTKLSPEESALRLELKAEIDALKHISNYSLSNADAA